MRPLALLVLAVTVAHAQPPTPALIPLPAEVETRDGPPFVMTDATPLVVDPGDAEARRVAGVLAALVGNTVETTPPIVEAAPAGVPAVRLRIDAAAGHGDEGYALDVASTGVDLVASAPAGLFYGVQTLRQLLPARVEYEAALYAPLPVPAVRVVDRPRYEWRGMMLDVARHFFEVEDVERVIDLMALHKLNRLHLHLSDDQGWRIEIPSRPALARVGGRTEVGGGPGGYYTVEDIARIVQYAAERFITVVPEIDLPGHTNAALAAIPEINCDGRARAPYTGTNVGFSTVCVEREETWAFVEDVVASLAEQFPGETIHLGGDEVEELTADQYAAFVTRAQAIVTAAGKRYAGWDDVAHAGLAPGAVIQVWRAQRADVARQVEAAVANGAALVLSPSDRIYIDMKYDESTVLGLTWAGLNGVRDAYDWDPGVLLDVPEAAVLGVEAPLWAETLSTIRDVEFMAFPRLAGVAEIGWTPQTARSWGGYRARLGAFGPRWTALGVHHFRSPEVDWTLGGVE
ncbi:beta-N-acetylhexosaminidase [Rubrivirga marina]|uniref:beta-N-acetylhexosaminidase n=1 Tax=Rubrivirga marina TaxID=1196024 RepID=A0A271IY62_9BACT|nr:beta-N-acetylhexosaminidase [Rubrivirga marina]PAP75645.1 hypothetical protein BSZ37_03940 [Rubrivirga marina]